MDDKLIVLRIIESTENHIFHVRELFNEYAASLDFDLSFQGFAEELKSLPGDYALPSGSILLATVDGEMAGCVALRKFENNISEMKRLYVRPQYQGQGVGRALASAIIEKARELGYKKIRLDTVPAMKAAIGMYQAMGFKAIAAYRENPVPGTAYLEKNI